MSTPAAQPQITTPALAGVTAPLKRIPFTKDVEDRISWLAFWMTIAAVLEIIAGVANGVGMFFPQFDLGKGVSGLVSILIGVWLYLAATSFKKVATSDTADQMHLVEGFRNLRLVFLLKSVLIIITLALVCAALLIVLAVGIMQGMNR